MTGSTGSSYVVVVIEVKLVGGTSLDSHEIRLDSGD